MAEKRERLFFLQRPPGSGYFAGHTEDVPKGLAKNYKNLGYARPATPVLPDDLPGRDELIAAGVESVDELKDMSKKELEALDGIGKAKAGKIVDYFTEDAE